MRQTAAYCEVKVMVVREEFYVDSADHIHMIHGFRWFDPEKKWKGILQLVHGMLEYIERHQEFAEYMAEAGYFVIGHDHLGHGESVADDSELGYVGRNGDLLWLKDIEQIRRMAVSYGPKLPYLILGHSMGSFLVRRYLIYNGNRVDGAVIMGTGHQPRPMVKLGLLAVGANKLRVGERGRSRMLNQMTCSGFAKLYPDNANTGSWMSRDPEVLIHTLQDKKMHFSFTVNGFEALFKTIEEVTNLRRAARMPRALPLLVVSGGADPVGENGKGVRRFERMLRKIGMKRVTCILYPDNRHELINDLDKELVFRDICRWCGRVVQEAERR